MTSAKSHHDDCYYCMANVSLFVYKETLSYPSLPISITPVELTFDEWENSLSDHKKILHNVFIQDPLTIYPKEWIY